MLEFFNILNRPNFALRPEPNGLWCNRTEYRRSMPAKCANGLQETAAESPFNGAATIGTGTVPGTVGSSRQVQLALKIIF